MLYRVVRDTTGGLARRQGSQHRLVTACFATEKDILTILFPRQRESGTQPESRGMTRPYLAVLVTFGNVDGPIPRPEAAVQNSPNIADGWEYQSIVESAQEDCVHSTEPFDFVLGSADAVELKPPM